jgi:threonine aldolase
MDRRQFLAAGTIAAASPALAMAGVAPAALAPAPFQRINFSSDGLGLGVREYATLLHETTQQTDIAADYYSNGGLIADIERRFAELLGKPAAVFLPTGTLANHLAVRTLAGPDRRVLLHADSHLYNDSGDCATALSQLNLIPLAAGRTSFTVDDVERELVRAGGGRVPTPIGVLSIETPLRRHDHAAVDVGELRRVCAHARERGIRLHLDGARLFTLPLHTGVSVREYAALFDTVYVSLWKHFNAGAGAILAGDAAVIDGLSHQRRMFGGSLPRAWPEVALVPEHLERFERDYADAWRRADRLIERLQAHGRFAVRRIPNGTSRFFLRVEGIAAGLFAQRMAARGVVLPMIEHDDAFGMQVNATLARIEPDVLSDRFVEALAA